MEEAENSFPIASDQVPYSMVNRAIENDVVPYCHNNNIGILAYSPLQRGLLTGKIKKDHVFKEGDSRPATIYYKEPNFSRIQHLIKELSVIADDLNVTLSQLVLNWTINQPGITCALAGARNAEQVLENVKATDFKLTNDEIALININISNLKLETNI